MWLCVVISLKSQYLVNIAVRINDIGENTPLNMAFDWWRLPTYQLLIARDTQHSSEAPVDIVVPSGEMLCE